MDSPPTVYGEAVVFGSADGWVYCISAKDGELVWRFRGGSVDRRIVAYDQVESVWPVHGNVLVTSGSGKPAVWFVAGRSSSLSGGMRLCKVDLATGNLLAETKLDTTGPDINNLSSGKFKGSGIAEACLPDILSSDGTWVFMRHARFDMKGKRFVDKRRDPGVVHLFSPTGFLDDSWWHRTYWQVLKCQLATDLADGLLLHACLRLGGYWYLIRNVYTGSGGTTWAMGIAEAMLA